MHRLESVGGGWTQVTGPVQTAASYKRRRPGSFPSLLLFTCVRITASLQAAMARQTRSATHQRRSNTRRSSPRASPSPVPSSSSLSPRKRSRTHEDDYDDSLEERETVGKVPTAARKTRRTTAAAVTPASVLTSSDKTSTSIPRLIRSLPRRAGKVLDAEQKEADGSARSARLSSARRQANVDEVRLLSFFDIP